VDANSAYTLESAAALHPLDDYDLLLIEQPLAEDDLWDHSRLQKRFRTPICLDESITQPRHARQALEMVRKTRSWKLLRGYRGRPPADVDSFVRLLVNLSRLAVDRGGGIVSLDLNPVLVLPEGRGCAVVDWRVFRGIGQEEENGENGDIAGVSWQNPDQGV
jgi:hypothetical protein